MEIKQLFAFWDKLDEAQKRNIEECAISRTYKKGESVYNGDDCMGFLAVQSGQLRVFTQSDEGKQITLYRLFEGDMCLFSASCVIKSVSFDIFVEAAEDSFVCQIPASVYKKLTDENIAVANYTNEVMAQHFSDVMWILDQVLNKKLDARIASLLLEECDIAQTDYVQLTHEQIASHLGSAREVVTRMLRYFAAEGIIRQERGKTFIADRKALQKIASGNSK